MPLQPRDLTAELIRFRHVLHQYPEIGLDLPRTQEKVLHELDGLPFEVSTGRETTSVTAVLRGRASTNAVRPVVLLRADMDALPVQEQTGIGFASRVEGAMHACGHDLHTAMLTGAARLLADRVDQLPGDVVLMFQPGEEGCDGASVMLREGVLEAAGRTVDAAYAMHVFSGMAPHGQFLTKPGVMMSASDGLEVIVHGEGGHGSAPHHAKDPVTTAAEMVTALQVMVTRQLDMFDPAVLTVGVLQAGTRRNVIPDSARFEATVRTFSEENRDRLQRAIPRLLKGIASAHGLAVEVHYITEYPRTVTDLAETERAEQVISRLLGEERLTRLAAPVSGSEDFSHVLDRVPGTFIGLGAATPGADPQAAAFNHSPRAIFDDDVLTDGAALYAELATTRLASLVAESTPPRAIGATATA
jgi:amidohydrolase